MSEEANKPLLSYASPTQSTPDSFKITRTALGRIVTIGPPPKWLRIAELWIALEFLALFSIIPGALTFVLVMFPSKTDLIGLAAVDFIPSMPVLGLWALWFRAVILVSR